MSLSATLLIIFTFLGLSAYLQMTASEKSAKHDLQQYTKEVGKKLDTQFSVYKDILEVSSKSTFFTDFYSTKLVSSINAHLKSYIQTYKDLKYFYFGTKTEDMYIFPYVEMKEGYNPRQTEWYRLAEQSGETSISSIYLDNIAKTPIITVSKPIYNIKKELVGVMGIDVKLENLVETVKNSITETYSEIILLDRKNEPIEIEKGENTREIATNEAIQEILKSKDLKIAKTTIAGESVLANAEDLGESGYKLLILTKTNRIIENTLRTLLIVFSVGLVLIILSTIVFYQASKKIVKDPLNQLKKAFSFDSNGQVKLTRVDCKTNDEWKN